MSHATQNVMYTCFCTSFQFNSIDLLERSGFFHQHLLHVMHWVQIHSSPFCRYHTGSLAFGSLILSLVQVIRVILEYLDHKLKGQKQPMRISNATFWKVHLSETCGRWLGAAVVRTSAALLLSEFLFHLTVCSWWLTAVSSFRSPEQICQIPAELHEVLLLVPREMHQVPQQERLHHGELNCRGKRREGANTSKRVADVVRGLFFFVLQVAIYGKSFCPSARDAFFLLMRNIIRYRFALLKRHVRVFRLIF